jgi:hypothetical protein
MANTCGCSATAARTNLAAAHTEAQCVVGEALEVSIDTAVQRHGSANSSRIAEGIKFVGACGMCLGKGE